MDPFLSEIFYSSRGDCAKARATKKIGRELEQSITVPSSMYSKPMAVSYRDQACRRGRQ